MNIQRNTSIGRIKKALFYLLTALLGGCVPVLSLHPLYTEKDVIFEEKLLGTWIENPDDPETIWRFSRADDPNNEYKLVFSDDQGKKGSFTVHLVKLKSKLFLDVYPSELPWEIEDPNKVELPYNSFFMIPAHTFIKIDTIEPELKMRLTSEKEIKKLLEEQPDTVEHMFIEDKLILTAPIKELQSFVLKYADDERVFKTEIVLRRSKINHPNN